MAELNPPTIAAFDCETWPIRPGQIAPRLVCVSFYGPGNVAAPRLYHRRDRKNWLTELREALVCDRITNQNIAYDFAVLLTELQRVNAPEYPEIKRLIWQAYDDNRVRDTQVQQMLYAIATGEPMAAGTRKAMKFGGFSLGAGVKRWLGEDMQGKSGPDVWRSRYNELDAVPCVDWPEAAHEYARLDPWYARRLHECIYDAVGGDQRAELRNVRAMWALHLAGCWGVRTDGRYVNVLERFLRRRIEGAYKTIWARTDWLRDDGSRDMTKLRARLQCIFDTNGIDTSDMLTDKTKELKTDRDTMQLACDIEDAPDLQAAVDVGKSKTDLQTFVPRLHAGITGPINARWNVLVESERLSCKNPNLTNQPTHGIDLANDDHPDGIALANELRAQGISTKIGVRACFVPRVGRVFIAADYATAELRAFAQIAFRWFGFSSMRDTLLAEYAALQAGRPAIDLHVKYACRILNVDEARGLAMHIDKHPDMKQARQLAKRCNFGLLGGMGKTRFEETARKDGVDLTLDGRLGSDPVLVASQLIDKWLETWPEVRPYRGRINEMLRSTGGERTRAVSFGDGLIRGNVKYTDACNHFFQNLVAQWLKASLYALAKEAYTIEDSPYYGARPVILPHDEVIAECDEAHAPEAAARQATIMMQCGQALCSDVPVVAEPAIMRRWYKGAEPVYVDGRLVPWEPRL